MNKPDSGHETDEPKNRQRYPAKLWPVIIEAVSSYAAHKRAQVEEYEDGNSATIARWTKIAGIGTTMAAIFAAIAAYVFWGQWNEMQREQRPWVYAAEIAPGGHIVSAEGQYAVPLKVSITNTGHLPAFFVQLKTAAVIIAVGQSTFLVHNDVCDALKSRPTTKENGHTVFAGQTVSDEGFTSDNFPAVTQDAWNAAGTGRFIMVYGCIDYQFPSEPGHHQSRFSLAVGKAVDQGLLKRIGVLPDDPTTVDIRLMDTPISEGAPAD